MLVIDKPPVAGQPPELPPYLRPKERPERRTIIIPDLVRIESSQLIKDFSNNWQTEIRAHMMRIQGDGILDGSAQWEFAHSHSRRYRQWLETYEMKDGIPPHICFGGCLEPSDQGDPTFYPRWVAWAKEYFA